MSALRDTLNAVSLRMGWGPSTCIEVLLTAAENQSQNVQNQVIAFINQVATDQENAGHSA